MYGKEGGNECVGRAMHDQILRDGTRTSSERKRSSVPASSDELESCFLRGEAVGLLSTCGLIAG